MRVLQITFLAVVLILTGSLNALSQKRQQRSAEDMAKQQTDWMKQELKLSKEQEKEIYRINLETSKRMKETWKKYRGNREMMQSAMKNNRVQRDKELKKALSEEQFKLYKKRIKEMRDSRTPK